MNIIDNYEQKMNMDKLNKRMSQINIFQEVISARFIGRREGGIRISSI